MTLLEVEELTSYWAEHPPLHLLVAAYLRAGTDKRTRNSEIAEAHASEASSDFSGILSRLGPGFGVADVHAGFSPVVLDFSELRRRAAAADRDGASFSCKILDKRSPAPFVERYHG